MQEESSPESQAAQANGNCTFEGCVSGAKFGTRSHVTSMKLFLTDEQALRKQHGFSAAAVHFEMSPYTVLRQVCAICLPRSALFSSV